MHIYNESIYFLAFGRKRSTKKHARSSSHQNISSGHESDGLKIDDKSANSSLLLEEKSHFRIPSTPVDTKYWVPDQSVSACQICKVQIFSTVGLLIIKCHFNGLSCKIHQRSNSRATIRTKRREESREG